MAESLLFCFLYNLYFAKSRQEYSVLLKHFCLGADQWVRGLYQVEVLKRYIKGRKFSLFL